MDLNANRELISAALVRIPDGDRAALQTVYRLTSAKLFGVCLRILGERGEAEEVLQEVYVTVWNKASNFDTTRSSPMTWLIAISCLHARKRFAHMCADAFVVLRFTWSISSLVSTRK